MHEDTEQRGTYYEQVVVPRRERHDALMRRRYPSMAHLWPVRDRLTSRRSVEQFTSTNYVPE